jgi:hypothetical protein
MAAKAAFASGLTVPELAKAAFVSKLQQFRQTGEMTFGPGRES